MEIRPAETDDREDIRTVASETWHETYDELDPETIDDTVDDWYDTDGFATALEQPGTAILVAADEDEIVGFTHGVVQNDEGDILRMYVHPDYQRQGIGSALYERLRSDLEDFNMNRIRALDLATNEDGRAFYETLGFRKTGEGEVKMGGEKRSEVVYTIEL